MFVNNNNWSSDFGNIDIGAPFVHRIGKVEAPDKSREPVGWVGDAYAFTILPQILL
jgi:hypothetical protein